MKKALAIAMAMVMLLSTVAALSGWAVAEEIDTDAPIITDVKPEYSAFVSGLMSGGSINVSACYSDLGSGIDITTVVMFIDGQMVPAVVSATDVYYNAQLGNGVHQAVVMVSDNSGNEANADTYFIVDSVCPKVSIKSPTFSFFTRTSATPLVVAKISDNIDIAGVQLMIDAKPVTSVYGDQTGQGAYTIYYQVPPGVLRSGYHTITIIVTDLAGNTGFALSMFRV